MPHSLANPYSARISQFVMMAQAKRWNGQSRVGVKEVRELRGIKGDEDTAIIITTGSFSGEARKEAQPGQNQRIVYLIDGEHLVNICIEHGIGVKRIVPLEILVLEEPEPDLVYEKDRELLSTGKANDEPEDSDYFEFFQSVSQKMPSTLGNLVKRLIRLQLIDPTDSEDETGAVALTFAKMLIVGGYATLGEK